MWVDDDPPLSADPMIPTQGNGGFGYWRSIEKPRLLWSWYAFLKQMGSGHLPTQILLTTYIDDRKLSKLKNVLDVLDNYLKKCEAASREPTSGLWRCYPKHVWGTFPTVPLLPILSLHLLRWFICQQLAGSSTSTILYTVEASNFGPHGNFGPGFQKGLLSLKRGLQKNWENESCRKTLDLKTRFCSFLVHDLSKEATELAKKRSK
jgi:hypothetical protein